VILDALIPESLPLGALRTGPFAACAVCRALDPTRRQCEEVRLLAEESDAHGDRVRVWITMRVPRRIGTFLYYGSTPICRDHARRIHDASWGPREGERWVVDRAA
jgi:hypothetical protein